MKGIDWQELDAWFILHQTGKSGKGARSPRPHSPKKSPRGRDASPSPAKSRGGSGGDTGRGRGGGGRRAASPAAGGASPEVSGHRSTSVPRKREVAKDVPKRRIPEKSSLTSGRKKHDSHRATEKVRQFSGTKAWILTKYFENIMCV